MRYLILLIFLSVELTGCTAMGESEVEEIDINELDSDLQEYVQNEEITNIMHVSAEDGDGDYIVFYAPGATTLRAEEADEGHLDIRVEKPDDREAEILHVYELKIGNEVETLRYFVNDEETHVEMLPH